MFAIFKIKHEVMVLIIKCEPWCLRDALDNKVLNYTTGADGLS